MELQYTIRQARDADKLKIHSMIRESIAREKKLPGPSTVPECFLEEFVDKVIRKGNMLVVENDMKELELIGEIHSYHTSGEQTGEDNSLKEFIFVSRTDSESPAREKELVSWLFGEIQEKHRDVFRVELLSAVNHPGTVDHYKKMGLTIEGNYNGRMKHKAEKLNLLIPLSWTNPSFN